jgi:small-conductance mechanosensitive channel
MKKRLLRKLKGLENHKKGFEEYTGHFFYSRLILAIFIFIIYFAFALDSGKSILVPNDLFLFGLFFAWILYAGVFNFARLLFMAKHKIYPLFNGEIDVFNGWIKFDYSEWERKENNLSAYYITMWYDLAVFLASVILTVFVTVRML